MKKKLFVTSLLLFISLIDVEAKEGVLKYIPDGDTLHFKSSNGKVDKCRIAFIDTPESRNSNKFKKDMNFCKSVSDKTMLKIGKRATSNAYKLLKVGDTYSYYIIGKGGYNRPLCIVELNNSLTFNEKMVSDGYAIPYKDFLPYAKKAKYNILLHQAKIKKEGLWGENSKYLEAFKCLSKLRGY